MGKPYFTPTLSNWQGFSSSPFAWCSEWIAYFFGLAKKPTLLEREADELRDGRAFLTEAASMTTLCPSEFASAPSSSRKEVASIASDVIEQVDSALQRHGGKSKRDPGPWTDQQLIDAF